MTLSEARPRSQFEEDEEINSSPHLALGIPHYRMPYRNSGNRTAAARPTDTTRAPVEDLRPPPEPINDSEAEIATDRVIECQPTKDGMGVKVIIKSSSGAIHYQIWKMQPIPRTEQLRRFSVIARQWQS